MANHRSAKHSYSLTREQKLSVGVLGICGVIALLFSIVQVRRALIHPFTTPIQTVVDIEKALGPTAEELDREAKKSDTDKDGISDYDELNVYLTSPYLKDSDSDGEPDNIEIAKGTDPNCAAGTECVSLSTGDSSSQQDSSVQLSPINSGISSAPGSAILPSGSTQGGPLGDIPERDPVAIRAFLLSQGVSPAELEQYTDEEILEAYDASIAQNATPPLDEEELTPIAE